MLIRNIRADEFSIPEGGAGKNRGENKQEHYGHGQQYVLLSYRDLKSKLALLLILAGMCLLLVPVDTLIIGTYNQVKLERQWRKAQTDQTATEPQVLFDKHPKAGNSPLLNIREPSAERTREKGFPPTKLLIPRIGLKAVVVEGATSSALRKGPGHLPDTALPGQPGNCCIAGHRNMYGSWFRRLDRLAPGDRIILQSPDEELVYQVADKYDVLPTDLRVLEQTHEPTLTLITCTPVPRPTHRLIVSAKFINRRRLCTQPM